MTTTLVLIITTSPSELPLFSPDIFSEHFFHFALSVHPGPIFLSLENKLYSVWEENESLHSDNFSWGQFQSLSDNNIIRIMSHLSILLPLSLFSVVTPQTGVQGLVWFSREAWGSALCCTEYVSSCPWRLMIHADLFLMSQFHMWE